MIVGALLAAGGARRFGSQKLVAPVGGVPLVRRSAERLAGIVDQTLVVVGSDRAQVESALAGLDVTIVGNDDWAAGMSSSIRAAVLALPPQADAVLIALGDEPMLDLVIGRRIISARNATTGRIVVPNYAGTRGHPVLFDRSVFPELVALSGDAGARSVIQRVPGRVTEVAVASPPPPDVDTPADLAHIRAPAVAKNSENAWPAAAPSPDRPSLSPRSSRPAPPAPPGRKRR